MTKTKSTLLFLTSLLTLVGCNGEHNSSLDSTSSSDSTSTSTVKKIRDIYDVIENLGSYEFAIDYTESGYDYTYNFYGDSASSIEYTSDTGSAFTGVIDTKNDGVWTVKKTDDGYSLDQCVSMGNVYSTIAATCFDADIYSYVDVITEDEDALQWIEDATDDYLYTTDDKNTVLALIGLSQYGYYLGNYSKYVSFKDDFSLLINEDYSVSVQGKFTITYNSSARDFEVDYVISKLGSNSNESFLALANATIPSVSSFSSDMKKAMTDLLGEELPYYDGFTNYYTDIIDDDSLAYVDLNCGNVVADYGTLLLEEGYELSEEDEASDDYAGLVYSKVITEGTATTLEVSSEISVIYMSSSYMAEKNGEVYGEYYVNGYFCIEMAVVTASIPESEDYATINSYLNGYIPVPKFSFDTTALKSIAFLDYTEMYNLYMEYMGYSSYVVSGFYMLEGEFDTEANAVTNLNTWITTLLSSSFTVYAKSSTNADGKLKATGDSSVLIKNNSIEVDISMTGEESSTSSSSVTPSGDFSITIIVL